MSHILDFNGDTPYNDKPACQCSSVAILRALFNASFTEINDYERFLGSELQHIGCPNLSSLMCSSPLPRSPPSSCLMYQIPGTVQLLPERPQQISPVWLFTLAVAGHPQNCMSAKVFHLCIHEPPSSISSPPPPPRHAVGSAVHLSIQTLQSGF